MTSKIFKPIVYSVMLLFFASCFKDEDKIMKLPPRQPGDPILYLMNSNIYGTQAYFNLETNETVAEFDMTEWDLGFGCSDTGYFVILNPATKTVAANVGYNYDTVISPSNIKNWYWDKSDGNRDSTGMHDWLDYSNNTPTHVVFYVDRGYSWNGISLVKNRGYKKVTIDIEDNRYKVRYADILYPISPSAKDTTVYIDKNPLVNFVSLSFTDGSVKTLEPAKDNWHLLFTQYTGKTPDDDGTLYDYFVKGVLINTDNVKAIVLDSLITNQLKMDSTIMPCSDTAELFDCISYYDVLDFQYSSKPDTIGHLWKDVTVNTETGESYYSVNKKRIHLIKIGDDTYFKFRFLDFNNASGQRGFVSFEYQQL